MTRIPVTILTGFLGAGKTTLLNRLLAEPGFEDTAVVINEFGEAGVDGALVERKGDRAFAMSTGCLCCTVSGDVTQTLLDLLEDAEKGRGPVFQRMVIETTGLADPMPVLQTFMSNDFILQRYALNGVVTLIDGVYGGDAVDQFDEAHRQAAVADMLLVTKGDLMRDPVSKQDLAALKEHLASINPNAKVMEANEVTADAVFSLAAFDPAGKPPNVRAWLQFNAHPTGDHEGHDPHHHDQDQAHDVNRHGDTASAFCFSAGGPVDPGELEKAITALQNVFGTNLLRMKGLIELEGHTGCPLVLHVVGHIASPPNLLDGWPDGVDQTRMVLIVSGSDRNTAPDILMRHLPTLRPFQA